jgi:myo-inositol-1-phosphate synthase
MNTANWISLIAGLGIGTVLTAMIQHLLKLKEVSHQSQRQDLEKRYRVVILLMYVAFDFELNKASLNINRPDLKNQKDVLEELEAEWTNMLLFASKSTLDNLHTFIQTPNKDNLHKTALSMRKDLGRGSIEL